MRSLVPFVLLACGKDEIGLRNAVPADAGTTTDAATDATTENGPWPCEVKLVDPLAAKPLAPWTPCSSGGDCSASPRADLFSVGRSGVVFRRDPNAEENLSFEDIEGNVRVAATIPPSCYPYVFVGPMGIAIDHREHYFRDGVYPVPPRIVSFVRWTDPTKVERHAIAETSGATGPWSTTPPSTPTSCAPEHVMFVGTHALFDLRCDEATLARFAIPLTESSFDARSELGPFSGVLGVRTDDALAVLQDGAVRVIGSDRPAVTALTTKDPIVALDTADNAFVSVDSRSGDCDAGPVWHTVRESVVLANDTVTTRDVAKYEVACIDGFPFDEARVIAHDGYVAVGARPIVVRRSDGMKLAATFEYPIRDGTSIEGVVYLDSKWLVTLGGIGLVRRPIAALSMLP
jgi:hypothetical protein